MTIVVHSLIYHLFIYPILLCIAIGPFIAMSEIIIHKFKIRYKEIPRVISYILAFISCIFLFSLYDTYYPAKEFELYFTSKNKTIEVKREGMYLLTTDKEMISVIYYDDYSLMEYEILLKNETTIDVSVFFTFQERHPLKVRSYYTDFHNSQKDKVFSFYLNSYFEEQLKEDIKELLQQNFSLINMDEIDGILISNLEEEILLMAKNKLDSEKIQIKISIKDHS